MNTTRFPDTLLDQQTRNQLLKALQVGVIDMAHFPQIYFPPIGEPRDYSLVAESEISRYNAIAAKINYSTAGQLRISRDLTIRLLKAIRSGRINLHEDFPELAKAYRAVDQDWSAMTAEEKEFLLDFCRKTT